MHLYGTIHAKEILVFMSYEIEPLHRLCPSCVDLSRSERRQAGIDPPDRRGPWHFPEPPDEDRSGPRERRIYPDHPRQTGWTAAGTPGHRDHHRPSRSTHRRRRPLGRLQHMPYLPGLRTACRDLAGKGGVHGCSGHLPPIGCCSDAGRVSASVPGSEPIIEPRFRSLGARAIYNRRAAQYKISAFIQRLRFLRGET